VPGVMPATTESDAVLIVATKGVHPPRNALRRRLKSLVYHADTPGKGDS
jgi:hypothetical protein